MKGSILLTSVVGAVGLFLGWVALGQASAQAVAPHTPQLVSFWTEDFSAPLPAGDYYITATDGSGVRTPGNEFRLTEGNTGERGRIFYLTPARMDEFVANFSLYLGDKDDVIPVADGAAFIFCPSYDYAQSSGPFLDASCPGGYIVAFDTYEIVNDIHYERMYVAFGNTNSRICQTNLLDLGVMANGIWHDFSVILDNHTIEVSLDGRTPWECVLPDYQPFIGYFGFSASTGGFFAEQLVDNITIEANPIWIFLPFVFR
jgi:hypothetical protein